MPTKPAPRRVETKTLFNHGLLFAEAADRVQQGKDPRQHFTLLFLMSRSAELVSKAYLLAQGKDESYLRKIGHNLVRAVEACADHGLSIVDTEISVWRMMNDEYLTKALEYPGVGAYRMPLPYYVRSALETLIDRVAPTAYGPHWDARIKRRWLYTPGLYAMWKR